MRFGLLSHEYNIFILWKFRIFVTTEPNRTQTLFCIRIKIRTNSGSILGSIWVQIRVGFVQSRRKFKISTVRFQISILIFTMILNYSRSDNKELKKSIFFKQFLCNIHFFLYYLDQLAILNKKKTILSLKYIIF